jgi:hypothetical protein
MSIEGLIEDNGEYATITVEAPDGVSVAQDAMGGADRSDPWIQVAAMIPCLVRPLSSALFGYPPRNDARANMIDATIYFKDDPVPSGISTRHRITVTVPGTGENRVLGVYAVQGVIDPNTMGELYQVAVQRLRILP